MAGKISDLTQLTNPTPSATYVEALDTTDTSMAPTGTNKRLLLSSTGYSPATKVVAPAGSGFAADYYTTGTNDDVKIQLALDTINTAGGGILILFPGFTYTIAAHLLIYSNTTLIAYGATIQWSSGSLSGTMLQASYESGHGANTNISVKGGSWVPGTVTTLVKGMILGGSFLDVRDLEFTSSDGGSGAGFSLQIHNSTDFTIENIFFNGTVSDGVHISGPAARGSIKNIHGNTNDDMVAILPNEVTPFSLSGDITDITVDGVKVNNNSRANAVRVLSGTSGVTVYNTKRIKIANVSGTFLTGFQSGIWIGEDTGSANTSNGQMDDITIDNVSLSLPDTTQSIIRIVGSSTSLEIPSIKLNNITVISDVQGFLHLDKARVENLIVNNVTGKTATQTWIGAVFNDSSTTDIKNLTLSNISLHNNTGGAAASQLINSNPSAPHLRNIHLSNIYLDHVAQILDTSSTSNVFFSNVRMVTNNAVFNLRTGAAVTVQACNGLTIDNTSNIVTGSAGTIESKSANFPFDILNARTSANLGDMAYNINSAANIGIGPVTYDGSVWQPMSDTPDIAFTFAFGGM